MPAKRDEAVRPGRESADLHAALSLVAVLERENKSLQDKLIARGNVVEKHRCENYALKQKITELTDELTIRDATIAVLQNKVLTNQKNSSNSSTPIGRGSVC